VMRVSTFVGDGAPLNTTGNLVSRNATKICGCERRWGREGERGGKREGPCSSRKIMVTAGNEHARFMLNIHAPHSLLPADYSRKERGSKTR